MPKKSTTVTTVTDDAIKDNIDLDQPLVDDFSDLFEQDEGVPFRVELVRLEPEIWENVHLRGFLCELEPGTTYSQVKEKYGGGRYRADKRDATTGRYIRRRQFEISPWIPKIDTPDGDQPTGALSLAEQPKLDVAGVGVPISQVEHIKELVLWTRAIKVLLPDPPDSNSQLLTTLIELVKEKSAPSADPLELLTKLRAAVPEIFERSTTEGSNLYSLLQEAIRQTGSVLAGGKYRPLRIAKPLKDKPQPTGGAESGAPVTYQEGDEPMMTPESGLMLMLGELIKAFRLVPPKEPKRVVTMLDHLFALTKEQRAEMTAMREVGLDIAENQLIEDFVEDASLREKFAAYYTEVFDLYTNPEREAV